MTPRTFETRFVKSPAYYPGKTFQSDLQRNNCDSILVDEVKYCHFLREVDYSKGDGFKTLDYDANALFSAFAESTSNLLQQRYKVSLNTNNSIQESLYRCGVSDADVNWPTYIANNMLLQEDLPQNRMRIITIVRTVTYFSPEYDVTMGVVGSTGDVEYFSATRVSVFVHNGPTEVYKGSAGFKDYLIQPEDEPFNYSLPEEAVDSLMTLALSDFLIKSPNIPVDSEKQ